MSRRRHILVALAGALAACNGDQPPTSPVPSGPSREVSDGANGFAGNKNFFFLPPLAKDPSKDPDYEATRFDGAQLSRLSIEVCPLPFADADLNGRCDNFVKQIPSSAIAVSIADPMYYVNWKTDDASPALSTSIFYRIRVLLDGKELGYAELDPVSRNEIRDAETGALIPLQPGRTLPIKFRLEENAVGTEPVTDFVEVQVYNTGGSALLDVDGDGKDEPGTKVETNTKYAGAFFPDGWLPVGYSSVIVRVERVRVGANNDCHNAPGLIQFEGCYRYRTIPELPRASDGRQFQKSVVVAMCSELLEADPRYKFSNLFKSNDGANLKMLPENEYFPLLCGGFTTSPAAPNGTPSFARAYRALPASVRGVASRLAAGLGSLVAPRTLYAVDLGVGGRTEEFSNIGRGIPTQLESSPLRETVEDTTGIAGETLATPFRMRVFALHDHGEEGFVKVGLPSINVTLTASNGGGVARVGVTAAVAPLPTITLPTDTNGYVSVAWTLGAAGENKLTATISTASVPLLAKNSTVTRTVTADPSFTELSRVGSAVAVDTTLLLTSTNGGVGAAWHPTKFQLAQGFTTSFRFLIDGKNSYTDTVNTDGGGDGFAFVIQSSPAATNAIGYTGQGTGSFLGYAGITNSLAVEFDAWDSDVPKGTQDGPGYDPDANHISIQSRGADSNSAYANAQIGGSPVTASVLKYPAAGTPPTPHTATITYVPSSSDGGTLTVTIDGMQVLSRPVTLPLGSVLDANGAAYVGFTASTGFATENHRILSWTLPGGSKIP